MKVSLIFAWYDIWIGVFIDKPKGQSPAGWMCLNCIHKHEPELAKNIEADLNNEPVFKTLSELPKL